MSNMFETKIEGKKYTFQPFNAGPVDGYHVEVKDEEGARHEFRMERGDEEQWQLKGENLPAWISEAQDDLRAAVEENS